MANYYLLLAPDRLWLVKVDGTKRKARRSEAGKLLQAVLGAGVDGRVKSFCALRPTNTRIVSYQSTHQHQHLHLHGYAMVWQWWHRCTKRSRIESALLKACSIEPSGQHCRRLMRLGLDALVYE